MTELQIQMLKAGLVATTGIAVVQSLKVYALKKRLRRGRSNFENRHKTALYLLSILEENNVDLSEFDVIALSAINEGS